MALTKTWKTWKMEQDWKYQAKLDGKMTVVRIVAGTSKSRTLIATAEQRAEIAAAK